MAKAFNVWTTKFYIKEHPVYNEENPIEIQDFVTVIKEFNRYFAGMWTAMQAINLWAHNSYFLRYGSMTNDELEEALLTTVQQIHQLTDTVHTLVRAVDNIRERLEILEAAKDESVH